MQPIHKVGIIFILTAFLQIIIKSNILFVAFLLVGALLLYLLIFRTKIIEKKKETIEHLTNE